MRLPAVVIAGLCVATPAKAADPAWSALARSDLQAIHDVIRDNHPGPVDPENARYLDWLETGLRQATARATDARTYFDYVRALRFYTNGFQDGHIGLALKITPFDRLGLASSPGLHRMAPPRFILGPNRMLAFGSGSGSSNAMGAASMTG